MLWSSRPTKSHVCYACSGQGTSLALQQIYAPAWLLFLLMSWDVKRFHKHITLCATRYLHIISKMCFLVFANEIQNQIDISYVHVESKILESSRSTIRKVLLFHTESWCRGLGFDLTSNINIQRVHEVGTTHCLTSS